MESSYNGWPASPDPAAIGVDKSFLVAGVAFPGGVKAGDVATVLGYVADQFHRRVEPLVQGWCWGYNYRAATNSPDSLSCHSSGTALDVNAPDHPDGASGTFSDAQVATIRTILAEAGDVVVSGMDWSDDMHFEIDATAAQVAAAAEVIRLEGPVSPGAPTDEGDGDVPLTEDDLNKIAQRVWSYMVGGGGAGATLEEIRKTNRDINAKCSKLVDPRNGNVDATG
jgi:hypothetical protein